MSDGVTDSKLDKLEEILNLRRKQDFSFKMINNIKDKLQAYDNKDHVKSVNDAIESKKYCEGIEVEIVSLRADLEKSNKKNEKLLEVFEEKENWMKEYIIKLKEKLEEERKDEEGMRRNIWKMKNSVKDYKLR